MLSQLFLGKEEWLSLDIDTHGMMNCFGGLHSGLSDTMSLLPLMLWEMDDAWSGLSN